MTEEQQQLLKESLKTISNFCAISLIVLNQKRDELLPSVLEVILIEAQNIVGAYCIED